MRDDSIALNVHAIPSGERNIQKKRSPRQICRGLRDWCGREDSNFHGLSPTATSTLRVYQFRHDRSIDGRRYQIATTHARTALLTRSALFAARSFGSAHMRPRTRFSDCTRQQAYAHGGLRTWRPTHMEAYAHGGLRTWRPTHMEACAHGGLRTWLGRQGPPINLQISLRSR